MEKRSNLHLREVFDAVFKKNRCQYLVVDKDMNITSYSENTAIYYELSNLENNTNLFRVMEELVGYEDEVKSLFLNDSKILEILFVAKKNNRFINISVQKSTNDVLVILLEDVSRYAAFYQNSVHDRNEKELLLLKTEKQNTKLLQVSQDLEKLANKEIEKNKQKEHILMQQAKMAAMGDMIANITHQWKQPLNALNALNISMIFKYRFSTLEDKDISMFNQTSDALITQMSDTIDDFMNFFKPKKEKKYFDVYDSLAHVSRLISSVLKSSNIELQIDKHDKYIVFGYKNELQQVLINLINNAKDALVEKQPINPKIIIKLTNDKEYSKIEISDNAGGIAPNILDNIFDLYFTTKSEDKGTGIGLYMSKLIIEKHMNGTIEVYNDSQGACFVIKFKTTDT